MQNLIPKFSQNSIISEKPGYFSEKLKALASSNYHRNLFFCWNFAQVSYLTMSTKGSSEFFFILCRSWVINKNLKSECVETRVFLFLQITQDLNKIILKKHSFVDIAK